MSEYHQTAEPQGGASPIQVSSASANNPVQIILTPPTPIVPTGGLGLRGEDTHKEVHRLPDVSEEKQVVEKTDYSNEKQVFNVNADHDEKEVYIPGEGKEVYDHGLEKEVHNLNLHDGHDEKQFYDPNNQTSHVHHVHPPEKEVVLPAYQNGDPEKELYNPNHSAHSLPTQNTVGDTNAMAMQKYNSNSRNQRDSVSTQSTETSESQSIRTRYYQRHVNKLNQAVDKKKKAWTTFTNQSSTSITEKYNQMDKDFKDRRMAFENDTTAKMSQIDKSISDSVDRAGQNVNTKVANFRQSMVNARSQSISSVRSLGSKCQIGGKEGKEEVKGDKPV
ncbi:Ff.00g133210.m01.CDS01 [Fusarium sp. VM40]|nr:Ff.00g133210.m01.CDS01 [Fusarium sp. VM40]